MERLLRMEKLEFVDRMVEKCRKVFGEIADAVNDAPDGNVINGSEIKVRDLMADLRRDAFETAVQMRVDSTESTFSPSEGRVGEEQGKQGTDIAKHGERERANQCEPHPLVRQRRRG